MSYVKKVYRYIVDLVKAYPKTAVIVVGVAAAALFFFK
jgi:hypothetical protein